MLILFAPLKTLITFAPAFEAGFTEGFWIIRNKVKRDNDIGVLGITFRTGNNYRNNLAKKFWWNKKGYYLCRPERR